jgi:probable F420-dependent oxidoreductase
MAVTGDPQLSTSIVSFAADDPGDWDALFRRARVLDAAGVDRLVVSDHVVFGEQLDAYGRPELGGQAGGRQPTGPDGHWLEPLTTLSFVAAQTTRIRLGTNILLAALRRPVVLAKTAATIDVLSGGRLDLGVGVGWQREEYDAAGLDFGQRGRLLDHSLEVCRALWRNERASYDAPELRFDGIHQMPKPRQPGGVPIWVSGTVHERVARRIARFGSGWIPWGAAAADPAAGIREMRALLDGIGHDWRGLQVVGNLRTVKTDDGGVDLARTMDAVPALVEAGVTDVRAGIPAAGGAGEQAALDAASAFVEAFRAAVGNFRPSE